MPHREISVKACLGYPQALAYVGAKPPECSHDFVRNSRKILYREVSALGAWRVLNAQVAQPASAAVAPDALSKALPMAEMDVHDVAGVAGFWSL